MRHKIRVYLTLTKNRLESVQGKASLPFSMCNKNDMKGGIPPGGLGGLGSRARGPPPGVLPGIKIPRFNLSSDPVGKEIGTGAE